MEQNIETRVREIFSGLKTRKKFSILKIEGNKVAVEEFQEICGQKEPKRLEFLGPQELENFVKSENKIELDVQRQLSGNEMPYR
ncbi:MAG: hypothetical protein A3K09_04135 [Nitrospinae bacterium RIFCSPLOWO2_12_FULL_47_7]|nr:MAG: hypothetical protein A3K09_04135 [Nitrospinae bacterium RIFCSPLOWO2_12_FULL_47_7]